MSNLTSSKILFMVSSAVCANERLVDVLMIVHKFGIKSVNKRSDSLKKKQY
jgi:hypothetical protein